MDTVDELILEQDDRQDLATQDELTQAEADIGLSASDVLARVEAAVEGFVAQLAEGQVPSLQLVSRSMQNVGFFQAPQQQLLNGAPTQAAPSQEVMGLGQRMSTRSLLANQGASALSYARVFVVLGAIHELLRGGRQATQRDLYYKLLKPPLFKDAKDVNGAIQDAVALLRVPRASLGLVCSGRGAVAGLLQLREGPAAPWQDCSAAGPAGRALPGDLAAVERFGLRCGSARYLLLVEKDAVFQRLAEDRLWERVPCVLVTAKGMPDLGTRAFAARLLSRFPALQPLGLVDYNPAGAVILRTYKYGNARMGLEAHRYALPTLKWLGLRSGHLAEVEEHQLQPLTARDRAMLPKLVESLQGRDPGWASELEAMAAAGYKADLEVLQHTRGYAGLADLVAQAVVQQDFV